MPGVKKPVNSWMYWKAWSKLPSSGRATIIAITMRRKAHRAADRDQVLLGRVRPA